jgi:hypothetical protein
MSTGHEKRLSRLEKRLAERTTKPSTCNCRVETLFHGGCCLDAILKGMSRVCPLHGFRELGVFCWTSKQFTLLSEDNEFCPCPPDPWRSFVLSGNHTWEAQSAARETIRNSPPAENSNFKEDDLRVDEVFARYSEARHRWVDSGGRLPDREELVKLAWQRARKHA